MTSQSVRNDALVGHHSAVADAPDVHPLLPQVRLTMLKKKGVDIRVARDHSGRCPMQIALEADNVPFIRSILRIELGEEWAMRVGQSENCWGKSGRNSINGAKLTSIMDKHCWRDDEHNFADSGRL